MRGFRNRKAYRRGCFLRFVYGLLLVFPVVLSFTVMPVLAVTEKERLAASGIEVIDETNFQSGGELAHITIFYLKKKDGNRYAVAVQNQYVCESTVVAHPDASQPTLVFNNCTNGWDFSLGEWNKRVISYHAGSRVQEVHSDSSILAWWCRTIIGHHLAHK